MRNSQRYNIVITDFSTSNIIKTTLNHPNLNKKYLYWIAQDYYNTFPSYRSVSREMLIMYIKETSRNQKGVLQGTIRE